MSMWQEILATLNAEFSDFSNVAELTTFIVRLCMAALFGAILGFEREQRGKAAGVKTHMLVAVGSALFVLVPYQAGVSSADLSRVMQGVIAGIGFLGAGAILKKGSDERDLKGLTTAASIWVTSAIGLAAGMGRESSAVICTLLALFILTVVPRIAERLEKKTS